MFKYKIIRNAIEDQTCEVIKNTLHIWRDVVYKLTENQPKDETSYGDPQSPVSFSINFNPTCDALLKTLTPLIEQTVDKKLFPTYSFARIYYKGSYLHKHIDRPSCEYSITVCLDNNPRPWAIFMDGEEVILERGDIVVYKGCDVIHWREPLDYDTEVTQVFLHYVDQNGPYSEWKYDKRSMLGEPPNVNEQNRRL
jgi:hypothetical protein